MIKLRMNTVKDSFGNLVMRMHTKNSSDDPEETVVWKAHGSGGTVVGL
jgi:hypothetical protein